ncbi:hypothetical protein ACFL59_01265 [Planctomycetota bacterium]
MSRRGAGRNRLPKRGLAACGKRHREEEEQPHPATLLSEEETTGLAYLSCATIICLVPETELRSLCVWLRKHDLGPSTEKLQDAIARTAFVLRELHGTGPAQNGGGAPTETAAVLKQLRVEITEKGLGAVEEARVTDYVSVHCPHCGNWLADVGVGAQVFVRCPRRSCRARLHVARDAKKRRATVEGLS